MSNWEEVWDEFKLSSPEVDKYGEKVAKRLCELDMKYDGESAPQRARTAYETLLEHFDGDVPEWIQDDFVQGLNFNKDYILENLQTHNYKGMVADLEKRFGHQEIGAEVQDGKEDEFTPIVFLFVSKNLWEKLYPDGPNSDEEDSKDLKDLKKIVEFYGYFISQAKEFWFSSRIWLEPRYPEDAYDYVHRECGGWGYTIVPKDNIPGVDAAGLRCKSGNNRDLEAAKETARKQGKSEKEISRMKQYRYFPERIYFSAWEDGLDEESQIIDICDEIGRKWEDVAVYRINFNKLHCPIYRDPAMKSSHAFFIYHNVPPSLLEKIHDGPEEKRKQEEEWSDKEKYPCGPLS